MGTEKIFTVPIAMLTNVGKASQSSQSIFVMHIFLVSSNCNSYYNYYITTGAKLENSGGLSKPGSFSILFQVVESTPAGSVCLFITDGIDKWLGDNFIQYRPRGNFSQDF
eukprot:TRINITY_DN11987_c0_g1_i13.p3 TRINITY_DN11987_c0_g1~~TRINITY_DN11987_c0_g1_i13.p3  ORF type:complete len:110 (-),score=1.16 TRINITY_DN11987_c0_g1_i13:1115-1444(-)